MDSSYNQLTMKENNKKKKCRSIWLDTRDAVVSADKKTYTFEKLPLIIVKADTKLYLKSIDTVSSSSTAQQLIGLTSGANMSYKLQNVRYEDETHISSSHNMDITLYDGFQHLKNDGGLEGRHSFLATLLPQDINSITLLIDGKQKSGLRLALGTDPETYINYHSIINLIMEYEETN